MDVHADLTGLRFGILTVIERTTPNRQGRAQWLCRCDCGKFTTPTIYVVQSRKSCGCTRTEDFKKSNTKHGMCGSPEYACWAAMMDRCRNPSSPNYPRYGGRGIKVCEEWHAFANFYADMGDRPSLGHSLDRVDNEMGYSAANCRWATQQEQAINRSRKSRFGTGVREKTLRSGKKRYVAYIKRGTQNRSLGTHDTPELAHAAYMAAFNAGG